ncbi:hypothetical protein PHLCEN_2v8254 [Hermanssonia centrifuga]|uniref:Uncharacterized protein n=1 Tax=Hermanssonia centrifuga TaxID=98765 RepID=A0A2R6NU12_9APHY|nr:hypothetical protein PHLCEN_2v8254 [Hermanssonia centrifuga]
MADPTQTNPAEGVPSQTTGIEQTPPNDWTIERLFAVPGVAARTMPEPTEPVDMEEEWAIIELEKYSTQHLEAYKAQIDPRRNVEIENALAASQFKRTLSAWHLLFCRPFPLEIIQHIFYLFVYSAESLQEINRNRLRLTWVCRDWRAVAINHKYLWNTLCFGGQPPWASTMIALERAGNALLHVRIMDISGPMPNPSHEETVDDDIGQPVALTVKQVEYLLSKLLRKISQIRTMVVHLKVWQTAFTVLTRLNAGGRLDRLMHFEIRRGDALITNALQVHGTQLYQLPTVELGNGFMNDLQTLVLDGMHIHWPGLHLESLCDLELRLIPILHFPLAHEFRRTLASCSGTLRNLRIESTALREEDDGEEGPFLPIVLDRLDQISISRLTPAYVRWVLSQFRAPTVTKLNLNTLGAYDAVVLLEWLTTICRFPLVEHLGIVDCFIHNSEDGKAAVVRWLETMPRVKYIRTGIVSRNFLDAFAMSPWDYYDTRPEGVPPAILPALKEVVFEYQDTADVVSFIEGRERLKAPLDVVKLSPGWRAQPNWVEGYERIKATGVRVDLIGHCGHTHTVPGVN